MSERLDYERQEKLKLIARRGVEFSGLPQVTQRNLDDLQRKKETGYLKAAKLVDDIREDLNCLRPVDPRRQIAHLEHLFRRLSPAHKRSKGYGLLLKEKIVELTQISVKSDQLNATLTGKRRREKSR